MKRRELSMPEIKAAILASSHMGNDFTEVAADRALRGVEFGRILMAAQALRRAGQVVMEGITIRLPARSNPKRRNPSSNPASPLVTEIKRHAVAAGFPVTSVKAGTGSLRGGILVYFGRDLPSGEVQLRASRWLRAHYPDVTFYGDVRSEPFCAYWLDYSAAERKAKDARTMWSVRGNPRNNPVARPHRISRGAIGAAHELKALTDRNDHAQALVVFARDVLGSPAFTAKAEALHDARDRRGYMDYAGSQASYALYQRMMAQLKRRANEQDYNFIRKVL